MPRISEDLDKRYLSGRVYSIRVEESSGSFLFSARVSMAASR